MNRGSSHQSFTKTISAADPFVLLTIVSVASFISGCSSLLPPHEEPQHGPRARIRVSDINAALTSFTNEACENRKNVAHINGFMLDLYISRGMPERLSTTTPAIEAYIDSAKPFYGVYGKTWPGYFASDFCRIPFKFSPETGADYEIDAVYAGKDPSTNKEYCRLRINRLFVDNAGKVDRRAIGFDKLNCDQD